MYYRNTQYFLTKTGLSPSIKNDILDLYQYASYNLRSGVAETRRNIKTNKFGFKSKI